MSTPHVCILPDANIARCIGSAPTTANDKVSILVAKSPEPGLWLLNSTDEAQTLRACELAGFNTGAYSEKPLRIAKTVTNGLPWIVPNDFSLMVLIGEGGKSLHSFAELCCVLAMQQGVTELTMTDHDVAALGEDLGCTLIASCCSFKASVFDPCRMADLSATASQLEPK